jgi:hypothetical protein
MLLTHLYTKMEAISLLRELRALAASEAHAPAKLRCPAFSPKIKAA